MGIAPVGDRGDGRPAKTGRLFHSFHKKRGPAGRVCTGLVRYALPAPAAACDRPDGQGHGQESASFRVTTGTRLRAEAQEGGQPFNRLASYRWVRARRLIVAGLDTTPAVSVTVNTNESRRKPGNGVYTTFPVVLSTVILPC